MRIDPEQDAQPIMQVTADIRRWDLVAFSVYLLPRRKLYWIAFGLSTALYFFLFFAFDDRNDAAYRVVAVFYCAFLGAVVVAASFLFGLAWMLFNASDKSGQLGTRVFTLRKDGLHEQTPFNEGLNRWKGILSVIVRKHDVYIRINQSLSHIIPARAFTSRADFDRFSKLVLELWTAATRSS